jgi:putative transposase
VGDVPYEDIGRKNPTPGVHMYSGRPTIVLLTVCTKDRRSWLASDNIHQSLRASWQSAQAWLVGYYLIIPDHVHLFCAPYDANFTLESWTTFWKSRFRRLHKNPDDRWQSRSFHHRLRAQENYTEKSNYVRENPIRKGLVHDAGDWPYQGMINTLQW